MEALLAEEIDCLEYIPDAVEAHHEALAQRTRLGLGHPQKYTIHLTKEKKDRTLGTASYTFYGGEKDITLYINESTLPKLTDTIGHELDHAHFFDSIVWNHIRAAGIWAQSAAEKNEKLVHPMSEIVKRAHLTGLVRPLLEARAYFATGVVRGEDPDAIAGSIQQHIMDEYVNRIYTKRMKEETAIQLALSGEQPLDAISEDLVQSMIDEKVKPLYRKGVEMGINAVHAAFKDDVSRFERAQEVSTIYDYYAVCLGDA